MSAAERVIIYVELIIALIGCWGFVIMYTRTWEWWKNEIGRHLVSFSGSLGLLLLFYAIRIFWRDMPARGIITIILFGVLTSVIMWRLLLFLRIRRELRQKQKLEQLKGQDSGTDARN